MTRILTRRPISVAFAAGLAAAGLALVGLTTAACSTNTSNPHDARGPRPSDAKGAFPVTVTAANGSVHVTREPNAIVSLSPTATEMLYAIGAGSQVKAVDSQSDYPPQAPMTKLSGFTPNVEAIAAEKPDLVVATDSAGMLTKRLAAFHIPVLALPAPPNVGGMYAEFDQLGQATGHERQARKEVTVLRAEIRKIVAAVPHHSKPISYYYELDQTFFSVTSDTFIGKLLGLLGMKSIADKAQGAAAAGGYPQLSAEYVVKANPDFIILADTVCCHQSASTVAARPGWSGMTAVKAKHVIMLNDDIASRWGPRVVNLLRTMLSAIKGS
ncbi:MAG: ABC transporter substrate-binding protein [Nocardiopsaceae bacterium]|jgi:iron complex transport system substrate-binding protein|nr:ABC transporter substrate-binding protein [Nocardiopsaceae bacterium]